MSQYSTGSTGQTHKGNEGRERLKDEAKDAVNKVGRQVKETANEAMSEVGEQASSALHEQQEAFAEKLDHVCEALHDSAQRLRDEDIAPIAILIEQASTRVERMAQYLREQELSDMYNNAQRWARKNPALFLGGCFVAGLLVSRLIKSATASEFDADDEGQTFRGGSDYGLMGGTESRFSGQGMGSQYGGSSFSSEGIGGSSGTGSSARGIGESTQGSSGATGWEGP